MKSARIFPLVLAAAAPLVAASAASAHTGHETGFSLVDGALHPLGGLDHLAAMISVGLWAALAGGRRVWAWPVASKCESWSIGLPWPPVMRLALPVAVSAGAT